jgi:O-antigen chain-terminating methyltransferase
MSDGFYRAFEERHRGSRELIKGRLADYMPFVEPLLRAYPSAQAVDLGCGRGEWLEVLTEYGFKPKGVDIDDTMLAACEGLDLSVEQGDALCYLSALPDESQAVVSAFHVVEHISFDQLQNLIADALRVLKPGGLLIMETPNPENIVVATQNFYLDPTHQKPIPEMLLSFVTEHLGFARVKTLRLNESKHLAASTPLSLLDVLACASPDYAVVAQKRGNPEIFGLLDSAFTLNYGHSMNSLAIRYQSEIEAKFVQVATKAHQAKFKAQQAQTNAQRAEAASTASRLELQAVYTSSSWKITRPLRGMKRLLHGDLSVFRHLRLEAMHALRSVIVAAVVRINSKPALDNLFKQFLLRFPRMKQRLDRMVLNSQLNSQIAFTGQRFHLFELQHMPVRARQIYQALKTSIDGKNREST